MVVWNKEMNMRHHACKCAGVIARRGSCGPRTHLTPVHDGLICMHAVVRLQNLARLRPHPGPTCGADDANCRIRSGRP